MSSTLICPQVLRYSWPKQSEFPLFSAAIVNSTRHILLWRPWPLATNSSIVPFVAMLPLYIMVNLGGHILSKPSSGLSLYFAMNLMVDVFHKYLGTLSKFLFPKYFLILSYSPCLWSCHTPFMPHPSLEPARLLRAMDCTLHNAHWTLHTANCTLHTAHCTLHTKQCTLNNAH